MASTRSPSPFSLCAFEVLKINLLAGNGPGVYAMRVTWNPARRMIGRSWMALMRSAVVASTMLFLRAEPVSFVREVAPVLRADCLPCHNADKAKGGYRLHTFQSLLEPGRSKKPPVVRGAPSKSHLFELITMSDAEDRMPKEADPLSRENLTLIKAWIEQGARFDGADPAVKWDAYLPPPNHPPPPERYPHAWPVSALVFRAGGQSLITGGYREVRIWETETQRLSGRWTNLAERVCGIAAHPDSVRLAVAGGIPGRLGEVRVSEFPNGKVSVVLHTSGDCFLAAAWSGDGRMFAAAGVDGAIRLGATDGPGRARLIEQHSDWVHALAFSPKGDLLVSGSRDRSARVFSVESGEMLSGFLDHGRPVVSVTFDAMGEQVFSGGKDGTLFAWQARDAKKTRQFMGCSGEVHALVATTNELFSACADGKVRSHRLDDGKAVKVLQDCGSPVLSLAWDAASQRLACGTLNGQVWILDGAGAGPARTFSAGKP